MDQQPWAPMLDHYGIRLGIAGATSHRVARDHPSIPVIQGRGLPISAIAEPIGSPALELGLELELGRDRLGIGLSP